MGNVCQSSVFLYIKPTLGCNLSCSYCYHRDGANKDFEKMTLTTLANIYRKLECYDDVRIIWHGGEPMLMGVEWFKQAIELQKDYSQRTTNSMLSNITLLDNEWIELLKTNKFGISTSLDGVKEVHDKMRCNSFDKVIEGLRKLKKEGIKHSVEAVVNIGSLPYLYESFQLFQELQLNVKFNPGIMCFGGHHEEEINSKPFEFAMKFLWDLRLGSNEVIKFNPMEKMYEYLKTGRKQYMFGGNCAGRATVLPSGDAYICSRFLGNALGAIGNVNDDSFCFGLDNPKSAEYYNMNEERIKQCSTCICYNVCRGGCFYNWIMNDRKGDVFCEAYKRIFEHIIVRLKQTGGKNADNFNI